MPGDKPFKTKELSAQIGSSRLSFAKSEYMEKYLDITPGSVSVLGLMNDIEGKVRLLIDEDVLTERYFGCHPCINTSSLKFTTERSDRESDPGTEACTKDGETWDDRIVKLLRKEAIFQVLLHWYPHDLL